MKQSSTEPPQKKLKQARLPFQILSPPVVKNNDVSPSSQCKRKASDNASEDDVVVSEINENKVAPVEKKAKIVSDEKIDSVRVDDVEGDKIVPAIKQNSKRTSNSTKKVNNTSDRKSNGKNNKKTETKNPGNKPEVVDFVDLCDSPVKNRGKDQDSKSISTPPQVNYVNTSVANTGKKQSKDKIDGKAFSSEPCPKPVEVESNSEGIISKDKDLRQQQKVSTELSTVSSEECKHTSSIDHENKRRENSDLECPGRKESDNEMSYCNEEKDSTLKSRSSNFDEKSNVKQSLKQPSIKDIVKTKSPNSSSTDSPINVMEAGNTDTNEHSQRNGSNQLCTPTKDKEKVSQNFLDSVLDKSVVKTPSTASDSLTKDDSSPSSECNTSVLSTPETDQRKKITKTPRRMTPKQLMLLKEKEERRKERERLKEEKEKKKAEEKEEKLKLKKEKEEERLRLKQEKEDEKRKEKEEREKKKQAELEQKNEEKRLKEEEKRQKEEEKRAKEEEKRKKEEEERKKKEEKRVKEELKEAEKRKSAQAFASFFVKTETKPVTVEEDHITDPVESNFQPFEVKNDMRLAPLLRTQLPEERRQLLDSALECSSDKPPEHRLYLEQLRSPSYICGTALRTWPPPDETDDEVIIIESEKPNEEMEVDKDETEKKPEKKHRRAKLLQFHENRRPPYWGTWRKKSKFIRPRAPLNQDKTILEYEVDSDDEWEEPEDGESLRGSEDEESQDEQYEEDNDMFVPHGYLSDGEGEDELDDQSPEAMKARLKLLQIEFEAERNEKQQKLKPRLIGCVWFCNSESNPSNIGSQIAELFLSRRAVWEGSLPVTVAAPLPSSPSTNVTSDTPDVPRGETRSGKKKKLVKESMVPDIIKKVHGSRKKLSKLLLELREEWDRDKTEFLPSKNCLAMKIRELATWERPSGAIHHCWYVKENVRQAYGLTDLNLPPPPSPAPSTSSPAANITKFTKVLTPDERLKLLRESPVVSKEAQKEASKTPPSTPIQSMKTPNQNAKTPTVKLGTSNSTVKKRVPLFSVGLKESPKQNTTASIMNFVTKSTKCEETETSQKQRVNIEGKVKKRITPITLTTTVSKPTPPSPSSENECIILDD